MHNRVAILGLGFVGQANAIALVRSGYEVWAKDIREVGNLYSTEDFNRIHFFTNPSQLPFRPEDRVTVIVSVNAQNGEVSQDLRPAQTALAEARVISKGLVILRSTIMPKALAGLDYDLYMPDFLHERFALEEAQFPKMVVLGFKNEAFQEKGLPKFILDWKEHARSTPCGKVYEGTAEAAAYIKYLINIWNALRIGFVNEFGDAIIRDDLALNHQQIIDFVMDRAYYLRYGKAFEGSCLPKDTEAFLADHPEMNILRALIKSNMDHDNFERHGHNTRQLFYGED